MSENQLTALQAIMVEEDDLDLFSDRIVTLHEQGKGRKAHAALRRHARSVRDPERRERLKRYLSTLRLWIEPAPAPSLGTLNGIGMRLYGNAQPADDGTRISTQWFTLLYIPVVPIASFVVEPADENSWLFYGRTPHPPWVRIPVGGWLAVVAVVVGLLGWQAFDGSMNADVVVYNGFSVPVEVRSDERSWTLPPDGHAEVRLPAASTEVSASFVGEEEPFETVTLDLSDATWRDTVYNVGARKVLVVEHWTWGPAEPEEDDVLYGLVNVVDPVDYVFVSPPEQRSVREGDTEYADVLRAIPEEYPQGILRHLFENAGPETAMTYAVSAALDGITDPMVLGAAMSVKVNEGAESRAVCDAWLARHTGAVELHRWCQDLRRDATPEVLAEYEALARANPTSAMYAYLAARMADGEVARGWLDEALARDPDYPRAVFAAAYDELSRSGDLERCEAFARRAGELDSGLITDSNDLIVRAQQLRGVSRDAIADALPDDGSTLLTMPQMLRLAHDPSRVDAEWTRLEAEGWTPDNPQVANVFANVALIAGDLDRLRVANASGGGMDLALALSEGATEEDQAWTPAPGDGFGGLGGEVLWLLHAEQQGHDAEVSLESLQLGYPGVAAFLRTERSPTVAEVAERLVEVDPSVHGVIYYVYFRRTGNPAFGRLAKAWSLPADLPYFTVAGR